MCIYCKYVTVSEGERKQIGLNFENTIENEMKTGNTILFILQYYLKELVILSGYYYR